MYSVLTASFANTRRLWHSYYPLSMCKKSIFAHTQTAITAWQIVYVSCEWPCIVTVLPFILAQKLLGSLCAGKYITCLVWGTSPFTRERKGLYTRIVLMSRMWIWPIRSQCALVCDQRLCQMQYLLAWCAISFESHAWWFWLAATWVAVHNVVIKN